MAIISSNEPQTVRANSSEKHKRIHTFLHHNRVGVLASVDVTDNPDASTIYYSIDGRFNVFFCTKSGTKKHQNFLYNPNVTLVVFGPVAQISVSVKGAVERVTGVSASQKIYLNTLHAALSTSNGNVPPISKLAIGSYQAYKIRPKEILFADYGRSDSKKHNRIFEMIEF